MVILFYKKNSHASGILAAAVLRVVRPILFRAPKMVLTPLQQLAGVLLGESPEDTGYNYRARKLELGFLHHAMVQADVRGYSCRSMRDVGAFNPGFYMDVAPMTTLRDRYGVHKLSVIVPGDAMGNRIMDGVNAQRRELPKVFEVGFMDSSGELTDAHPLTNGDQVCRLLLGDDNMPDAVQWFNKLRDHGLEEHAVALARATADAIAARTSADPSLPDPPDEQTSSHQEQLEWALARCREAEAATPGAVAPAIPLIEQELSKLQTEETMETMKRQYAITADDPANLPMAWRDLVRVHGLERRTDLNNRIAEAHGRVKKGTQDREGITMLLGGEEVWIRRRNLQSLRTRELLEAACKEHGVDDAELQDGLLQMGVEACRKKEVVDEYGRIVGGLYSTK